MLAASGTGQLMANTDAIPERDASTAGHSLLMTGGVIGGGVYAGNTGQHIMQPAYFNPNNITRQEMISNIASGFNNQQQKKGPTEIPINEGVDHYKKIFSFIQRKVEYENFRFKHPTLVAIVVEAINTKVTDNQRMFTKIFYRFHVS